MHYMYKEIGNPLYTLAQKRETTCRVFAQQHLFFLFFNNKNILILVRVTCAIDYFFGPLYMVYKRNVLGTTCGARVFRIAQDIRIVCIYSIHNNFYFPCVRVSDLPADGGALSMPSHNNLFTLGKRDFGVKFHTWKCLNFFLVISQKKFFEKLFFLFFWGKRVCVYVYEREK